MIDSLISVIVTSYNQGEFLKKTLDSIICQSYKYTECIIVDSGSTDNSLNIIEQYCALDKRFSYYTIVENGPSFSRNFGLQKAKGKYIQLLDGDDWLESDKLQNQLKFLKTNPKIDLVYSDIKYFSDDIRILENRVKLPRAKFTNTESTIKELVDGNVFTLHSPMFKKEIVDSGITFDNDINVMEDWDFWLRIALSGFQLEYKNLVNSAAIYRIGHKSLSTNHFSMYKYSLLVRKKNHHFLNQELKKINDSLIQKSYDKFLKMIYYSSLEKDFFKNNYYLLQIVLFSKRIEPLKYIFFSIYYNFSNKLGIR